MLIFVIIFIGGPATNKKPKFCVLAINFLIGTYAKLFVRSNPVASELCSASLRTRAVARELLSSH